MSKFITTKCVLVFLTVACLANFVRDAKSNDAVITRYLHPTGLELNYPSTWSLNDSSFADIEFVPPDQNMSLQGPTEAYFLWGLGLDPTQATEKQVSDQLKGLMEQIASFLQLAGEPEAFLGKKVQGFVYTWEGRRPDGNEVVARIFVFPQKHLAFALVALGVRENIVKREAIISEIFGTFSFKENSRDSKLVGHWISVPSVDQTQSNDVTESKNEMELNSDGSFRIATPESEAASEKDQEIAGSGRWYSLVDRIYFVSPGNVALTFRFEIQGESESRHLILLHPNGDRQEFQESSVSP